MTGIETDRPLRSPSGDAGLSKVPEVTIGFWAIKIIATTFGEVGGNVVTTTLGLGYAIGTTVLAAALLVALFLQLRMKCFHPVSYWTSVAATALAGTALADLIDRPLGFGYLGGLLFSLCIAIAILGFWYQSTGSIEIGTVTTVKVEVLFWATFMVCQTLGTSLADAMTAHSGLGYGGSFLLIGYALAALAALYLFAEVSRSVLFWAAFILTRPLGTLIANSLDKPVADGGLAIGDPVVSMVCAALLVLSLLIIPQRPGCLLIKAKSSK